MRRFVYGIAIPLYTLLFGTLAILGCLIVPNGNALIWMARPWARAILWTCRTRVRVSGRGKLEGAGPVIYITNHQSHFDVLALIVALPGQYRIIAKKELFSIPVFGWALSLAGFIKIDRSDREKAIRSLDEAARKLDKGMAVVVFAEGTRSIDGSLLPFKKGGFVLAISSRCPIVPISISGSRAVLSRNSLDINGGTIDVVIGEPIPTDSYTLETKERLIAVTRRAVEAGFTDLRRLDQPAAQAGEAMQGGR